LKFRLKYKVEGFTYGGLFIFVRQPILGGETIRLPFDGHRVVYTLEAPLEVDQRNVRRVNSKSFLLKKNECFDEMLGKDEKSFPT